MVNSRSGLNFKRGERYWTDARIASMLKEVTNTEYRNENGEIKKPRGKTPDITFLQSLPDQYGLLGDNIARRGGIFYWRKRIGKEDSDRLPYRSLKYKENFMKYVNPFVQADKLINPKTGEVIQKEPGKVPTENQLRRSGNYRMSSVANRWHGGINGVRAYYNEPAVRVEPKWVDWEDVEVAVRHLVGLEFYIDGAKIKGAGEWFSSTQLREHFGLIRAVKPGEGEVDITPYKGLMKGIYDHHESFSAVKEKIEADKSWEGFLESVVPKHDVISDMPSFIKFVDTNETARELVELFYTQGHLAELALTRVLSTAFPGYFSKWSFLDFSKLRKYKGNGITMQKVAKAAEIGFRDTILGEVILDMARDATFNNLGESPTEEQIKRVYKMVRDGESNESDESFSWLYRNIKKEFDAFMRARKSYYDFIRSTKERNPVFNPHEPTFGQLYGAFSSIWRDTMLHADVAGYGKTVQEIVKKIMLESLHGKKTTVVFGPTSAQDVWINEVNKNYPSPRMLVMDSYGDGVLDEMDSMDFVFMNYGALSSPRARRKVTRRLGNINSDIVFDESHLIKNSGTHRSESVSRITNGHGLTLISYTPFDSLNDVYNVISILENSRYPTPKHVRDAFVNDPLTLHAMLRKHMTRRGAEDMPKIEKTYVDLSEIESEAYSRILKDGDKKMAIKKLVQLRKATVDPGLLDDLFDDDEAFARSLQEVTPAKYKVIDEILEDMEPDAKAIIVSPYLRRGVIPDLQKRYSDYGALRIDGSIPYGFNGKPNMREENRRWFLENPTNRVLITNESGGTSLSLSYEDGPTEFIFLSLPTSLIQFVQYITRSRRRGNTNNRFHYLTAHFPDHPFGSVDDGIVELLESKSEANRVLLDGTRFTEENLNALANIPIHRKMSIASRLWLPESVPVHERN